MNLENSYQRKLFCEDCKSITDHIIVLQSANDKGVIFLKSCDVCFAKEDATDRNDECQWGIERIPVKDWNILISKPLF